MAAAFAAQSKARQRCNCHVCSRAFARKEHLLRHERTHTREKPFLCPHCSQSFSRIDARVRHVTRFCVERTSPAAQRRNVRRKGRQSSACDFCHDMKQKCNGVNPCDECQARNGRCTHARSTSSVTPAALDMGDDALTTSPPDPAAALLMSLFSERSGDAPVTKDQPATVAGLPAIFTEFDACRENVLSRQPPEAISIITEGLANSEKFQSCSIQGILQPRLSETVVSLPGTVETASMADDCDNPNTTAYDSVLPSFDAPSRWHDQWEVENWQEVVQNLDFAGDGGSIFFSDPLAVFNTSPFDEIAITSRLEARDGTFYDMATDMTPKKASALAILHDSCPSYSNKQAPTSIQQSDTQWLLTTPSLHSYDKDIINSFLSLFSTHIAETFTVFRHFRVMPHTPRELTLAMAAVGGLFCNVSGSFSMAKSMYNASQRNFIRLTFIKPVGHGAVSPHGVQTWMAFILFGICSGNQRYHEISEAHYMQLHKAAFECGILDPSPARSSGDEEFRRRKFA